MWKTFVYQILRQIQELLRQGLRIVKKIKSLKNELLQKTIKKFHQ